MADSSALLSWRRCSVVVAMMLTWGCQRLTSEPGRVDEAVDRVAQEEAKSKTEEAATVCAEEVVRKLCAFMGSQKSFGCDVAASMHVQVAGQDNTMASSFDFKFARPNRLAMIAGDGPFGLSIYSNGKEMALDLPMLKKYSVNPAPENFDDVKSLVIASPELAMLSQFNGMLFDLLAADPAKPLLADLKQTKYLGQEEVDGAMCRHVSVETESSAWEAWIDSGKQPLVRRFRPDMAKLMAQGGGPKDMQLDVTVNFKNWKLGSDYQEADFAFTPADGEQKVASILGGQEGPEPLNPLVGEPAPEFKVPLLEGEEQLDLAKHFGKEIVILDFWATWCGPCVRALPMIIAAADKYRDKGVVLYAMNQGEDVDTIRPFLEKEKLAVTVALDADGKIGKQYGVEGIPQTVIIGKDGKVQVVHVGFAPNLKQRLESELDDLLAGKDLATEAKEKLAAQAKEEPEASVDLAPSGMELAWKIPGAWQGVVADDEQGVVFVSGRPGVGGTIVDADGEQQKAELPELTGFLRRARLEKDAPAALLCFQAWGQELVAIDSKGQQLWKHEGGNGIDDVWAADLTGDGLDEIIVGYNGGTGIHLLDQKGEVVAKNEKIANVWHVCAGDVNGDGKVEVVTTAADGKVHVFDDKLEAIKDLDPAEYATMVRIAPALEPSQGADIIVCGGAQSTIVERLSFAGESRWNAKILGTFVNSTMVAATKPWVAIASRQGAVYVLDTTSGAILAQVGGQGQTAQVAWLASKDKAPLLIVTAESQLSAFQITGQQ